jgi:hypothetical protein
MSCAISTPLSLCCTGSKVLKNRYGYLLGKLVRQLVKVLEATDTTKLSAAEASINRAWAEQLQEVVEVVEPFKGLEDDQLAGTYFASVLLLLVLVSTVRYPTYDLEIVNQCEVYTIACRFHHTMRLTVACRDGVTCVATATLSDAFTASVACEILYNEALC